MEPRPQRPRSAPGQGQPASPSAGGHSAGAGGQGHPEGADPTAFIAPPRTQYDYSPLDLAPPSQRRRRQLVAAIIGAFIIILIGGIAIFGYLLLRDDEPKTNAVAATQTALAQQEASLEAKQTEVADLAAAGATGTPAAADAGTATGANGQPAATKEATNPASAPRATSTPGEVVASGTGPSVDELKAMLPDQSIMPVGLDVVTDTELSKADVAVALGGGRTAEQNLDKWGWSGNVQRSFAASDPASLDPTATINVTVSIHGFANKASAAEAFTFYSDILANQGWQEGQAPGLADNSRLLSSTAEDGTTNVALYVQKGNVLYRIGGSSPGGDPTEVVLQVAQQMFGA